MSTTELRRAGVLARVAAKTLTLKSAATLMEVSYRQAKRLYARYQAAGPKGLKHRSAGRASNRTTSSRLRARALTLIRAKYSGTVDTRFGPTLAAPAAGSPRTAARSTASRVIRLKPRVSGDHPWRGAVDQFHLDQRLAADCKAYDAVNP